MKINIEFNFGPEITIELNKISNMSNELMRHIESENKDIEIKATLENEIIGVVIPRDSSIYDKLGKIVLIFKCLIRKYCEKINDFSLSHELDDSCEYMKQIRNR